MTPEKLQGVTLFHKLFIGPLDRPLYKAACFYVTYSRVLEMLRLVLSEPLTMDYVNKFHPPIVVLLKMKELLDMSDFPPYATPIEQRRDMEASVQEEKDLCKASILKHFQLKNEVPTVNVNKRQRNDD